MIYYWLIGSSNTHLFRNGFQIVQVDIHKRRIPIAPCTLNRIDMDWRRKGFPAFRRNLRYEGKNIRIGTSHQWSDIFRYFDMEIANRGVRYNRERLEFSKPSPVGSCEVQFPVCQSSIFLCSPRSLYRCQCFRRVWKWLVVELSIKM